MGLSGKKLLLLGFVVVLMVIIPLTVYLVQQQQKLKVGAQQASVLSFAVTPGSSSTISKSTDAASFDVMLDPSTNQISFVKLVIAYDITKLKVNTFVPNQTAFPSILQAPDVGTATGKATITLSIGQDPNNFPKGPTKVATISFNALQTATAGTTQISFDRDSTSGTQVLSVGTGDQFNENVLANASPTTVTIAQAATGGTPTPTPTPTATPSGSTNKIPVCSSLVLDRQASGTAPYPLTFTASGTDSDGTITKVNFSFGDGSVTDVTTGGGIGTASVNTQVSHTYNNAGTFQAKATLTDNQSGVSANSCSQTITVTSGSSGGGTSGTGGTGTTQTVTVATPTPTPSAEATPAPGTKGGLPAPGPGDDIIRFGGVGILTIIVGALLLLAL